MKVKREMAVLAAAMLTAAVLAGCGNIPPRRPVVSDAPDGFVRVEGGTFTMDGPVTVSAFFMGIYQVTQKEYQEIMGTNPSGFEGDNLPVENVSWYDAVEYCNRRSEQEGLTPAYMIDKGRSDPDNQSSSDSMRWVVTWNQNANGYRLPTEAEWEYACRAGTTTAWYTGDTEDDALKAAAWYGMNSPSSTCPVGTKEPNSFGLYDMMGNVNEWCWDWYGTYSSEARTDPQGASSGSNRVMRGGGWVSMAQNVRSAYRNLNNPSNRYIDLGFRLVRN